MWYLLSMRGPVFLLLVFLPLCILLHAFRTAGTESAHFHLERLGKGIWAAINLDDGGHAICNAGIIDLGDSVVVVDPFMNLDAAGQGQSTCVRTSNDIGRFHTRTRIQHRNGME